MRARFTRTCSGHRRKSRKCARSIRHLQSTIARQSASVWRECLANPGILDLAANLPDLRHGPSPPSKRTEWRLTTLATLQINEDQGGPQALQGVQQGAREVPVSRILRGVTCIS